MTSTPLSRRDMLKGTVALAAAASVGVATTTRWRRAEAQESAALPRARIDGVLRQAVDARDVPGVVAMAATDKGALYEGAFGTRDLDNGPAMTLDTVFRIASMTKAITSVAAMQLVEQGKLTLNDPVPNIDPALGSPQVLEGFDAAGAPRLRPAKRPITLRHLLTHTAGFSYEVWDANTVRYVKGLGCHRPPPVRSRRCACRWSSTPATSGSMASTSTGSAALSRRSAGRRSTSISAIRSSPPSA